MNSKKIGMSVLALAMTAIFSGCSSVGTKEAKSDFIETSNQAVKKADMGFTKIPSKPLFTTSERVFVEPKPLISPLDPSVSLPPSFQKNVVMNFQVKASLSEIIARAQRGTGMTFTVLPEVYEEGMGELLGGAGSLEAAAPAGVGSTAPLMTSAMSASSGLGGAAKKLDVMVNDMIYSGTLQGFLDQLTAKTNLTWKWDGQRIVIYRYETKIFKIDALAGAATTSSQVGGGTTSSGSGSGGESSATQNITGGQQTSMTTFSQIWSEISTTVQSQLSAKGKMSVMPSAGTITVTDTPSNLGRISNFLAEINKSIGKQIMINVEVYSVETNDNDNYGIDWGIVWKTANSKFNILANSVAGASTIPGNLTASIVSPAKNTLPFDGSKAIIGALSTLGKTSLVSSASVITMNGLPAPVNVSREEAYLKSVSTTVTGTAGTSQTSMEPGLLTTGLSMTFTPRMAEGEKVLLQYAMDLSSKLNMDEFESNGSKIQIPSKSVRNFLQRVSMRSGQTLVLSGFQQTVSDTQQKGTGSAAHWAVSGSKNASSGNTTLVVLITPYVME